MAQLQHKTLGGVSPRGKTRVYFACHPQDYPGYFEEITNEILKNSNCAIYYYGEEPELDEEYYVNLERMQLIVMPVTTRLLYLPNRAMDVEFPYALEHHIPVLPLMQEQGLEEKYAEKFGNLQFLDKENRDLTAIPYEEKLKKYLDAVLLNDELTAQVRAAFDAWIFLSYRKKDRKAAQALMKLIHSDPRCRDIAIWYDEFLNSGEDFNDAILKALQESNLFVMAVTPNLVGETNYVMTEEYPKARDAGKPIVPAEMEKTDREALHSGFPGVPDPLDPSADGVVTQAVLDALGALSIRENDEDPKHNFFIGLAYLSGLFVEKDHPRAVKLITQAAEAGLTEAMEKLVTMHESGEGVEQNYNTAILWRKKLVEQARETFTADRTEKNFLTLINCMCELGDAKTALADLVGAKQAYEACQKLAQTRSKKVSAECIQHCRAAVFGRLGDICMSEGDLPKARMWYTKSLRIDEKKAKMGTPHALRAVSFSYTNLGHICQAEGNLPEARKWYLKGMEIRGKLAESGTDQDLRSLAISYEYLGDIYREEGNWTEARAWYLKAYHIREQLVDTGSMKILRDLSVSCEKLGYLCESEEDYSGAGAWYGKSLEMREKLAQLGTVESRLDLAISYERIGSIALTRGDMHGAREWFAKSLETAEGLAKTGKKEILRFLSIIYERLGAVYEEERSLSNARSWYTKALEIRESLSETGTPEALLDLSITLRCLGNLSMENGDLSESRSWYSKSVEICKELAKTKSVKALRALADCYQKLGSISELEGNFSDAYMWYIESLEIWEILAEMGSANDLEDMAVLYCLLGDLCQRTANGKAAVMYHAAIGIYRELMKEYPNVERYDSNAVALMQILLEIDSQTST